MNKLMGFYELKDSGLSCVDWKEFDPNTTVLESHFLWTVRTAVDQGDDLNLPRKVGVTAEEAFKFATYIYTKLKNNGLVIVYPYFIANKSGTLEVNSNYVIIEAVKDDLWNLVSDNKRDITIYESSNKNFINGNHDFLNELEYTQLKNEIPRIKKIFRNLLLEGKSILLEWSFAFNTNIRKEIVGDKYLVFYEIRSI